MKIKRSDFPYFFSLRVRYSEIDAQSIVFYAHYLTYFDTAIYEYLRWVDFDHIQMVDELQLDFHVVKATVEYVSPARFDDDLELGIVPTYVGNSSVTWQVGVFRKSEPDCLAVGEIIWVCAKTGAHQSHPLPENFKSRVNRHLS